MATQKRTHVFSDEDQQLAAALGVPVSALRRAELLDCFAPQLIAVVRGFARSRLAGLRAVVALVAEHGSDRYESGIDDGRMLERRGA